MATQETPGEGHLHIHDRARSLVEGMRRTEEARSATQRHAADFITEQMDRIAALEGDVAAGRLERDGLEGRLREAVSSGEAALAAHAAELQRIRSEHAAHVESLMAGAASDIERLKGWVRDFQAEMAEKQASLERDNARLALEGERLSEENAALAQTAEALAAAIEEHAGVLQRQDEMVEEAMRRQPQRPVREGSVVRMQPRQRPDAAGQAQVEAAVA